MNYNVAQDESSENSTRAVVSVSVWLAILFALLTAMMLKSVPAMERVFKDFDAELPAVTIWVLDLSNWYHRYWYLAALGWIGLMVACGLLCKTGHGREARLIRNLVAVAVLFLLTFSALGLYLPYQALIQKLS